MQGNINPLGYLYDLGDAFAYTGFKAGRMAMDIAYVSAPSILSPGIRSDLRRGIDIHSDFSYLSELHTDSYPMPSLFSGVGNLCTKIQISPTYSYMNNFC